MEMAPDPKEMAPGQKDMASGSNEVWGSRKYLHPRGCPITFPQVVRYVLLTAIHLLNGSFRLPALVVRKTSRLSIALRQCQPQSKDCGQTASRLLLEDFCGWATTCKTTTTTKKEGHYNLG